MLAIMERYLYGVEGDPSISATIGYNIKPTNQIYALCKEGGSNRLTSARWWFVPHWFEKGVKQWKQTTFNARIETAFEKPTFRTAWKHQRCIIPALGYYEWTGPKGSKTPNYITLERNEPLMFFAGLHSTLGDGTRTCTILTRQAEPEIADIHHRRPVILNSEEIKGWMGNIADDEQVIENYGCEWTNRFQTHPVAKFGIKDDGPHLIEQSGFDF